MGHQGKGLPHKQNAISIPRTHSTSKHGNPLVTPLGRQREGFLCIFRQLDFSVLFPLCQRSLSVWKGKTKQHKQQTKTNKKQNEKMTQEQYLGLIPGFHMHMYTCVYIHTDKLLLSQSTFNPTLSTSNYLLTNLSVHLFLYYFPMWTFSISAWYN